MQAQREYPPSLEDVKDKFLVQYTVAPPGTREVGADTFDPATNKDIRQTKLRVLLVRFHICDFHGCHGRRWTQLQTPNGRDLMADLRLANTRSSLHV